VISAMILARRTQVTFDYADPHARAAFWARLFVRWR
jgi:hypothetical protein